jgi:hypothetical protein
MFSFGIELVVFGSIGGRLRIVLVFAIWQNGLTAFFVSPVRAWKYPIGFDALPVTYFHAVLFESYVTWGLSLFLFPFRFEIAPVLAMWHWVVIIFYQGIFFWASPSRCTFIGIVPEFYTVSFITASANTGITKTYYELLIIVIGRNVSIASARSRLGLVDLEKVLVGVWCSIFVRAIFISFPATTTGRRSVLRKHQFIKVVQYETAEGTLLVVIKELSIHVFKNVLIKSFELKVLHSIFPKVTAASVLPTSISLILWSNVLYLAFKIILCPSSFWPIVVLDSFLIVINDSLLIFDAVFNLIDNFHIPVCLGGICDSTIDNTEHN